MPKMLWFLFAGLLLTAACHTPNGAGGEGQPEKWTLISFVAFMPDIPELTAGDIVWTMDPTDNALLVESRLPEDEHWGPAPGQYTYQFEIVEVEGLNGETVRQERISIEEAGSYLFSKEEDTMILDSNTDPRLSNDGPVMTFRRLP